MSTRGSGMRSILAACKYLVSNKILARRNGKWIKIIVIAAKPNIFAMRNIMHAAKTLRVIVPATHIAGYSHFVFTGLKINRTLLRLTAMGQSCVKH